MQKFPNQKTNIDAHLIIGGTRSGKSDFALSLASKSGLRKFMIATAIVNDDDMRKRVDLHRSERGHGWGVIEEPFDIRTALQANCAPENIVVVDCLTLWLSNLLYHGFDWLYEINQLLDCLAGLEGTILFITNELGAGTIPEHAVTRSFRDSHGLMNQMIAKACSHATLVCAGLPLPLK